MFLTIKENFMKIGNPLLLIKDEHQKVKSMLGEYKQSGYEDKKSAIRKINENLAVHMEMEEKIFYPKLKNISLDIDKAIEENLLEHEAIKKHIRQIGVSQNEYELDGHVMEMEEIILKHIGREEDETFAAAKENLENNFKKIAAEMFAFKAKAKGKLLINKIKS
jgi:iron-sulfur cluster repair protein YtfE (RIC family)